MPPVKAGGGASPLTSTASAVKGSSSSAHRSAHDGPTFTFSATGLSTFAAEASLTSPDLVQQLLRIARGDFTTIASIGAADPSGQSADSGSHAGPTVRGGNLSLSDAGHAEEGKHDSSGKAGGAGERVSLSSLPSLPGSSSFCAPVPVPVLRPSTAVEPPPPERPLSAAGGAGSDTTDAEACAFYLTALVAHALHREDYWVDLRHQIEVDQHVVFLQYCAAAGFGTLKTVHLLQWWRQFRALVRDVTATHALQLSDGNPQTLSSLSAAATEAAGTAAGGGSTSAAAGSAVAGNTDAHNNGVTSTSTTTTAAGKGAAKKGRRGSAGGGASSTEADADTAAATAAVVAAVPPSSSTATAATYDTHEAAVRAELQRFVQWELTHDYEWRLVPREPFAAATANGPLSPLGGGGAAAAAAAAGKSSKADKAKLQQQQQQEMEWEAQRRARIAALPPDNVFLTVSEVDTFVQAVVQEDLLQHAALHAYVATHDGPPHRTPTHAAAAPVFVSVQVETPMPVLPLREATRLVVQPAASTSVGSRLSGEVAENVNNNNGNINAGANSNSGQPSTTHAPTRPASSAPLKSRSRGNSRNAAVATASPPNPTTSLTTAAAATATSTEAAAAEEVTATPQPRLVLPSAMEVLRAEQAKEAAGYRAAYAAELAQAAAQAQQTQHEEDVNLFFEKSTTNTAVQAVYASMEDAVAARQHRILQRVAALEQALGLAESAGDGGTADGGAGTAAA